MGGLVGGSGAAAAKGGKVEKAKGAAKEVKKGKPKHHKVKPRTKVRGPAWAGMDSGVGRTRR